MVLQNTNTILYDLFNCSMDAFLLYTCSHAFIFTIEVLRAESRLCAECSKKDMMGLVIWLYLLTTPGNFWKLSVCIIEGWGAVERICDENRIECNLWCAILREAVVGGLGPLQVKHTYNCHILHCALSSSVRIAPTHHCTYAFFI